MELSREMQKMVHRGLAKTWEAIGPDYLELSNGNMPRLDVIEVTLDADYLESYGGLEVAVIKSFRSMSYEDQQRVAEAHFTFAQYGY